jgi:probable rRNA maturation factor
MSPTGPGAWPPSGEPPAAAPGASGIDGSGIEDSGIEVSGIDLDLAFGCDEDLAGALVNQAGALADPLAGADLWHERLSGWLDALQAELPEALQSQAYCLGLQLVSDASIAALNQDWRGKGGPTDVLAFAAQDDDLEGALPMPRPTQLQGDGEAGEDDDVEDERTDLSEAGGDPGSGDEDEDEAELDGDADDEADEEADEEAVAEADADDSDDDGDQDWDPAFDALELGDIVISLDTAARQAPEHGHSLEQELLFLASHGLLHLVGWDHPDDASLAAMLARQERLLAAAGPSLAP